MPASPRFTIGRTTLARRRMRMQNCRPMPSRCCARYSYGHVDQMPRNEPLSYVDIDRVRQSYFAKGSAFEGLTTFGVNLRGLSQSDEPTYFEDMRQARERKLKIAIHAGQWAPNTVDAEDYDRRGWLGPDLLICHYIPASDGDAAVMARTGTPLSFSTLSEMRLSRTGDPRAALMRMRKAGVLISLSFERRRSLRSICSRPCA